MYMKGENIIITIVIIIIVLSSKYRRGCNKGLRGVECITLGLRNGAQTRLLYLGSFLDSEQTDM